MATLNEPMNPLSWSQSSIQLLDSGSNPVAGTVSEPNSQTLVFVPTSPLLPGATYTVNVSGFTDAAGNAAVPANSTFLTGAVAGSGLV